MITFALGPIAALVALSVEESGEAAARPPLRLELKAEAVLRGDLVFLQASTTVTNTGATDLWITQRTSARIGGRVPWLFQVTPAAGDAEGRSRSIEWLCRINERPARPPRYHRLRPGESFSIELPFPCARLVDAGRYFVTLRFEDPESSPPPAPEGSQLFQGPLESDSLEVGW